jgi:hypothetical protein
MYNNKNELGDEFHYILDCPFFEQYRNIYIPKYYYSRPNVLKYKLLLSSKKKSELIKLIVKFITEFIFITVRTNSVISIGVIPSSNFNRYKKILNECGFAYIWNTQTFVDQNWLRLTIIRNLQDQFEQYWHSFDWHTIT